VWCDCTSTRRSSSGDCHPTPAEERKRHDRHVAQEWLAAGRGVGLEDLLLPGDRPLRETSEAICSWLGWI
jgi:hypothetical protein